MSDNVRRLSDVRAAAPTQPVYRDGNGEPCSARDLVRRRLGLDATRVVKYGDDDQAQHDLVLADGRNVRLGTSHQVLDQKRVRGVVLGTTPGHIVRLKAAEWDEVASALTSPEWLEIVDTGESQDAETRAWLRSYIGSTGRVPVDVDDRDDLADALADEYRSRVFRGTDRCVYIHLPTLVQHIGLKVRLRPTGPDVAARLARLGFVKQRVTAKPTDGSQARRVLWLSPPDFDPDDSEAT